MHSKTVFLTAVLAALFTVFQEGYGQQAPDSANVPPLNNDPSQPLPQPASGFNPQGGYPPFPGGGFGQQNPAGGFPPQTGFQPPNMPMMPGGFGGQQQVNSPALLNIVQAAQQLVNMYNQPQHNPQQIQQAVQGLQYAMIQAAIQNSMQNGGGGFGGMPPPPMGMSGGGFQFPSQQQQQFPQPQYMPPTAVHPQQPNMPMPPAVNVPPPTPTTDAGGDNTDGSPAEPDPTSN